MNDAVVNFIDSLEDFPGWKEWRRKKFGYVMAAEFYDVLPDENSPGDFRFTDEIEEQHNLIMLYLHLESALISLKDVEYYFRRYPFRNLPIDHYSHVINVCGMYFSRFYEFRERLKKYMNALNKILPNRKLDVGKFVKLFDKEFARELRARNEVHHHEAFDDAEVRYIYLTGILPKEKGWGREQTRAYRQITNQWAKRVRQRSDSVELFLDAVAAASIDNCDFLAALAKQQARRRKSKQASK